MKIHPSHQGVGFCESKGSLQPFGPCILGGPLDSGLPHPKPWPLASYFSVVLGSSDLLVL